MGDANRLHCGGGRLRPQQQLLPVINPFGQCMHFHFPSVIRAIRASCSPNAIPETIYCCATHAVANGVDPACVPVPTMSCAHLFGAGSDDAPEIRETNFADSNAMVADSNVECLSALKGNREISMQTCNECAKWKEAARCFTYLDQSDWHCCRCFCCWNCGPCCCCYCRRRRCLNLSYF